MKRIATIALVLALVGMIIGAGVPTHAAAAKPKFRIMWSIYVGWMPWPYAAESGIVRKWADKYGIDIDISQADYVPTMEAYAAGKADGVLATNMDALNAMSAAGVDSTAIIIGDYSNGNDALLTRNKLGICDLAGKNVYLVEGSVSHYLLARGFTLSCKGKVSERNVKVVNVSDSDIGPAFIAKASQEAMVTWNPIVLEVLSQVPGVTNAFNSAQIPNEILDIMFLRTETLAKHPELAKALTGAWYETLALMRGKGLDTEKALAAMAAKSGTTTASYKKQLETTYMYWSAKDAAAFTRSPKLVEVMQLVRTFSFDHGLFGKGYKSVDDIGIQYVDGKVVGSAKNVKFRFTDKYMQLAADGKL